MQSIPQESQGEIKMVVKHAQPFNGSKQVHTVSDLFEEDKYLLNPNVISNEMPFDRHNLNQLSTKSQPSLSSDKRAIYPANFMQPKLAANLNGTNAKMNQHFGIQTNIILPHPADV